MQQMFFIADLIACPTRFGDHYAHHQELDSITEMVTACGIWCFGFQVVGMVWSWGLCVRFAGCCSSLKTKAPNTTGSNHLYNTLELLMMGIMVPEKCWASNKICNKIHLLHLVGILFPHIIDDVRSKPHQMYKFVFFQLINEWRAGLEITFNFWITGLLIIKHYLKILRCIIPVVLFYIITVVN